MRVEIKFLEVVEETERLMLHHTTPLPVPETLICPVPCTRILIIPAPRELNMACGIPRHIVAPPLCCAATFRHLCLAREPVAGTLWKHPKELTAMNPKGALPVIGSVLAKLMQDPVKGMPSNEPIL